MTTEKAMEEAKKRRDTEKDGSTEFWNTVIRTLDEWQRHSEEIYKRAYDLGKRAGPRGKSALPSARRPSQYPFGQKRPSWPVPHYYRSPWCQSRSVRSDSEADRNNRMGVVS